MTSLKDKSVVVTGAGSGIGRATARAYAAAGARVLAVGRTESRLKETAADHSEIHPYAANVSDSELIVEAALERLGGIDILVNNAAVITPAPLGEIDRRQASLIFETNFFAPLFLTQQALPHLTGGTVVNLSTAIMHGLRGWKGESVYGASKVALEFLTRTWALELAPRGVRVLGIAPGLVSTPILANNGIRPDPSRMPDIPLGRLGTAEELAWWIVTVSRPEAGYGTGFVLSVDGGLSLA